MSATSPTRSSTAGNRSARSRDGGRRSHPAHLRGNAAVVWSPEDLHHAQPDARGVQRDLEDQLWLRGAQPADQRALRHPHGCRVRVRRVRPHSTSRRCRTVRAGLCLDLAPLTADRWITEEMLRESIDRGGLSIQRGDMFCCIRVRRHRFPTLKYAEEYPGLDFAGAEFLARRGS